MGRTVVAGRYRLDGELGRGGMGRVWRAHDETLGRDVALKQLVPPEGMGDQDRTDLRTRFRNEARTAGRLQHPGIVAIHDIVEDDDGPWIVMQLVEGRSLAEAIEADGPRPVDEVVRIGRSLVGALEAAHAEGVIHRDVTPRNVLLADNGEVVLGDFGIAAAADLTSVTQNGEVIGTPGYMAPERLRGQLATGKSDLWSLGATLYQAVEGDRPFRATEPGAVVAAVLDGAVAPPARAGRLEPLLLDLMAIDPGRRPDAAAVRRRLTDSTGPVGPSDSGTVPAANGRVPPTVEEIRPPDGGTLVQDRRTPEGVAAGPPSPLPAAAVFQPNWMVRLCAWVIVLVLGLGSWFVYLAEDPEGGCDEDSANAIVESTLTCEQGDVTAAGVLLALVGVAGTLVGGGYVISTLLRARKVPTLTIDDRGLDCRIGFQASRRKAAPQVPWHALREAAVAPDQAPGGVLLVSLGGHGAGERLPYDVHRGGYFLCRLKDVGAERKAHQITAAINAHLNYRQSLGLRRVTLTATGPNLISVTNTVQTVAAVNRAAALHVVQATPVHLLERVTRPEAEAAGAALEQTGATVTIEPHPIS